MNDQTLRTLIVDDSEDDALLIIRALKRGGYDPVYERVQTAASMKKVLKEKQWDVILCDYKMPKFNAPSAIRLLKETNIDIPLIIISGTIGEETAVECMRLGARDYFMKGNFSLLCSAIARELKEAEARSQQKQAEEELQFRNILLATQQEASIEGILVVDENNRILSYNHRFVEMWGLPAKLVEDRVDDPVLQFVTAQMSDPRSFLQRVQYIYEHRQENGRDELIMADGRCFDRYSTPMIGSDKRYFGRIWYFRDITERKRVEDELRISEKRYRMAENIGHVGNWEYNLQTSKFWGSDEAKRIYGFDSGALDFSTDEIERCIPERERVHQALVDLIEADKPYNLEFEIHPKNSLKSRIISSVAELKRDEHGNPLLVTGVIQDITERKQAEMEIVGMNRALRMLSNTNKALIHIAEESALLTEVCRIIVEVGGYLMAWVGFAEQDEAKTIRPVAHAGFESGYIESAKVTWANNERGRGPGGTAIRTGQPCITRNILLDPSFAPWCEAAIKRGYKSNIALPLINEGWTFGELSIYSMEADAFDIQEVEILKEMADDLAFGITVLRTRFKKDQTAVALRESEERYRLFAENTADTITVFDLNFNLIYVSPSILKLRGYTVEEVMTQTLDQILTPDSLQQASKMFADQIALESSPTADPARTTLIELEEYCKDGSTIWVELAASLLRDDNFKPTGILTVTRNITERKQSDAKLQQTLDSLRNAVSTTIKVLVSALEARDPYTAGHQLRVADLARAIATEMGLDQEKIDGIRMAGSIHDIGKLSIPAEILSKPTKLTNLEFSLIQEHSQRGYEMLKDVESSWPLAQIVYQHHERMNGAGYPQKLKGDEILLEARIMAVADVVEAMASHRPYRAGLGIDAALEEIEKNKGILYDDAVVDACLRLFRETGYNFS